MFVIESFRGMLLARRLSSCRVGLRGVGFRGVRLCGVVLLAGLVFSGVFSNAEAKNSFHTRGGQALEGYDAVSYFTQGNAVRGSPSYAASWGGVEWLFSSAKNRDTFLSNPSRYAPQFGGYCAYGISQGYRVRGDPEQWSVYKGKLYVNYSAGVKRQWQARKDSYITQARGRWPSISQ